MGVRGRWQQPSVSVHNEHPAAPAHSPPTLPAPLAPAPPPFPSQNALATTLRNAFSYTANHRLPKEMLPQSKKWGALFVANVLIRVRRRMRARARVCV